MLTEGKLSEIDALGGLIAHKQVAFDGSSANGAQPTAATLSTNLTGANNDLIFTAVATDASGNDITIAYIDPGVSGAALSVDVDGSAITVNLATDADDAATGTVTSTTNGNPSDGDTIVIGDETYTFKATLSTGPDVPFEVKIGADGEATLNNLRKALDLSGVAGTDYGVGTTANADVTAPEAAAVDTDATLGLEAIVAGAAGNALALTEDADNITVSGSGTLSGGDDGGEITSTAAQVDAAIDGEAGAAALVTPANKAANDGSGVVTAMAATNLSGGKTGTIDLFNVTGQVFVALVVVCSENLAGASATLRAGKTGSTNRYHAQVTGTNIVAGDTIDLGGEVSSGTAPNKTPNQAALNGEIIQALVGTADITNGTLDYYLFWYPVSEDGNVEVA